MLSLSSLVIADKLANITQIVLLLAFLGDSRPAEHFYRLMPQDD